MIDWTLVSRIAGPVIGAVVGILLNRAIERRARLITYLSHVSAFDVPAPMQGPPLPVFTHSIVVRNVGRNAAHDVRIGHNTLPNFKVFPSVDYQRAVLPGGGEEIVLPILVPGEQVSVSYLYLPPLTFDRINTGVKSNEGFAKVIQALPTPQPARWLRALVTFLTVAGCIAVTYTLVELARWLYLRA